MRVYLEPELARREPVQRFEVSVTVFVQRRNAAALRDEGLLDINDCPQSLRAVLHRRLSRCLPPVGDGDRSAVGGPKHINVPAELEELCHLAGLQVPEKQEVRSRLLGGQGGRKIPL